MGWFILRFFFSIINDFSNLFNLPDYSLSQTLESPKFLDTLTLFQPWGGADSTQGNTKNLPIHLCSYEKVPLFRGEIKILN